jgi:hypothetical protein
MCAPSTTDAKGEAVSLPESAQWVHAWQSFWVEICVSMDETTTLGISGQPALPLWQESPGNEFWDSRRSVCMRRLK